MSCLGPVLRLACLGGGGPVPFPPTWLEAARSLWGGCGRGDPSPTPQRALLRAGFARSGSGMRVPGGGRLLPGCGASGDGRSPPPDHSFFRACGRGPIPTGCGCGGCGRGDPSPTPQRALLRAGFARCGGGTRAPGGGASCLGVGRPGSGALPPPTTRPFGRAAGAHYPLAVGAGVRAWGPVTNPTARALASWLCALWGRHKGAPGGAFCLGVRRPGSGALPSPTTRPFGRGVGARYPLAVGAGGAGVGTRHEPHSARSCELPCALWGRHEGARGGRLLPGCGASGVGRSPIPDHSSFRACGRGPLPTGC